MTILLPTLAITLAAFCVWLTVRIVNRRERWAKRTAGAVGVLLAYPLSWGPALWLFYRELVPPFLQPVLEAIYWPMDELAMSGPGPVHDLLFWYGQRWM